MRNKRINRFVAVMLIAVLMAAYVPQPTVAKGAATGEMVSGGWQQEGSTVTVKHSMSSTALDTVNNIPYIAYTDFDNSQKLTVQKFEKGVWTTVGTPGFTPDMAEWGTIQLHNGIPYVVFSDWKYGKKATVMKYENGKWATVGNGGFTIDAVQSLISFDVASDGVPYMAYISPDGYVIVMKCSGSKWETVGTEVSSINASNVQLKLDGNIPYVAYNNDGTKDKNGYVRVKKFINNSWLSVGDNLVFEFGATLSNLLVYNHTPYLTYRKSGDYSLAVYKFATDSWEKLGTTNACGFNGKLYMDQGTLYLGYMDNNRAKQASVIKYDGANWSYVGILNFSGQADAAVYPLPFTIKGVPYVCYGEAKNIAGGIEARYTVVKYTEPLSIPGNQTLTPLSSEYASKSQETRTLTLDLNTTMAQELTNLSVSLTEGDTNDFIITQPKDATLTSTTPSTTFTVKAKDGLAIGTHTATISVKSENMAAAQQFTVTQVVEPLKIADLSDLAMPALLVDYGVGSQQEKIVTLNQISAGTIKNLAVALTEGDTECFTVTQPVSTMLEGKDANTTFTVSARSNLSAGTYSAKVSVTGDNLQTQTFLVTQKVLPKIVTLAGDGTPGSNGDNGEALKARLNSPWGITSDSMGNLYIADSGNNKIRLISEADGKLNISTVVGTGTKSSGADGSAATATAIVSPKGMAKDKEGNLYYIDGDNNQSKIRCVDAVTGKVSTIDSGLDCPYSITVDQDGNVYYTIKYQNIVKKWDKSTKKSSIVAGINNTWGYNGDGNLATSSKLNGPFSVCVDRDGNIYIADSANYIIRRVDAKTKIITRYAGIAGSKGYTGDGGLATSAKINLSYGICMDLDGNLFFTDADASVIRRIDTSGIITTIAGTGKAGYTGDGDAANLATFTTPSGLTIDSSGDLYVADRGNHAIRKILMNSSAYRVAFDSQGGSQVADCADVKRNELIEKPIAPKKEGYKLEGWYTDKNYTTVWNFDTDRITGNLTLFAKWTEDVPRRWKNIGKPGLTEEEVSYTKLVVAEGVPYVAFCDGGAGDRLSVMKYENNRWSNVGIRGFNNGRVKAISLSVYEGIPYVAYIDEMNYGRVMKYTGEGATGWDTVGDFNTYDHNNLSLYISKGNPYVVYSDLFKEGKATLYKYEGKISTTVGEAGFSEGETSSASLFIYENTPYVAYVNQANDENSATVMKYNGTSWEAVGGARFTSAARNYMSLYVDNGTPYLAYQDSENSFGATVMKYQNGGWKFVGSAGFSEGSMEYLSLVVDKGTPYVAYRDRSFDSKATVMKYTGAEATGWEPVGSKGFSKGGADYVSLSIDGGVLYVAYSDDEYENSATVMGYLPASYTVTFNTLGGSQVSSSEDNKPNSTITIPDAPTKEGYTFDGWYKEATYTNPWNFESDKVTEDITLYAKWKLTGGIDTTEGGTGTITASGEFSEEEGMRKAFDHLVSTKWLTDYSVGGTWIQYEYPKGEEHTVNRYAITSANDELDRAPKKVVLYGSTDGENWALLDTWELSFTDYFERHSKTIDNTTPYHYYRLKIEANGGSDLVQLSEIELLEMSTYPVTYDYQYEGKTQDVTDVIYGTTIKAPTEPTREGYTFEGWYKEVGYTNTWNFDKDTVTANTTLYAKWAEEAAANTVTYDGNGNDSGSVPVDNKSYDVKQKLEVQGNTGDLQKKGYSWNGWNTKPDGTGAYYYNGSFIEMPAGGITLYARWSVNKFLIIYSGNGNTGGSTPTSDPYDFGSVIKVSGNTSNLERTGYTFMGWNTKADGSGKHYDVNSDLTIPDQHVMLYAEWEKDAAPATYTVSFNSNGGSSVATKAGVVSGETITMPEAPTRTGYTFEGWYQDEEFKDAWDFTKDKVTANITLIANWNKKEVANTVTYVGNGSDSGSVPVDNKSYNVKEVVAVQGNTGELQKKGYIWEGWNTKPDGTGKYYDGYSLFEMPDGGITLYAHWSILKFLINYSGNSNTGGSTPAIDSYDYGSVVKLPDNTGNLVRTGYSFKGWNTKEDGSGIHYDVSSDLTIPDQHVMLYAEWEKEAAPTTYTVTFDSNGGSSVATKAGVVSGAAISMPEAPTKTGYTFEGWYQDAAFKDAWDFANDKVTENITLIAKWAEEVVSPTTYTVTFNSNGGSSVATKVGVVSGAAISMPEAPTKTGYTFEGWYQDEAFKNAWDFANDKVTANITLIAKWAEEVVSPTTYTVSFNSNGGSSVATKAGVVSGAAITMPEAPTKTGYTFEGWYQDATFKDAWDFVNDKVTANITLFAKWVEEVVSPTTYTVTFDSNGGSSVATKAGVVSGAAISMPEAPTKTGYTFEGWYQDEEFKDAWDFVNDKVTANITLFAKWVEEVVSPTTYTVSFDSNGGSAVATKAGVVSGAAISMPAAPTRTGYTFEGWYQDAAFKDAWDFANDKVTANITLIAKWAEEVVSPTTYTVSFNSNGGSSVATKAGVVSGAAISMPAAPTRTGYTFEGWYQDAAFKDAWDFANDKVTANITLLAKWAKEASPATYTVTFDSKGGSAVAAISSVEAGRTITEPTAPAKTGYTFGGWYQDSAYTQKWSFTNNTVRQDLILYARWNAINNDPTGNVSGGNTSGGNASTGSTNTKIVVDIKQGNTENTVTQIAIERNKNEAGVITDTVNYQPEEAAKTVKELKQKGEKAARIVIPEFKEEIAETKVVIKSDSIKELSKGGIDLQIDSGAAKVDISNEFLTNISKTSKEDLYFNLVPVKEEQSKQEIEKRAVLQVVNASGTSDSSMTVITNPVAIETNMSSTEADITLPLTGINLPTEQKEREAYLQQLAVYIEHSDGDKELVQGELVEYKEGVYGIRFHIKKFSTFTLVKTDAFVKSSDCKITKMITPVKAVIKGNSITAAVTNKVSNITVKATVSEKAKWKLYSDKNCTKVITNNRLALKTGVNIAYIKVTAQDKTTKRYKLTVTRSESQEAKITKVTMPENTVMKEKSITAVVPAETASVTINATVSNKAVWELYSDKACTKKIEDKKLVLETGSNTVYLKVIAQDRKISSVYTLKITREAALQKQYNAHIKLGLIGSQSYAKEVAVIFEKDYEGTNTVIKKEGSYYRVYVDFVDKAAAEKACKDMVERRYIVSYYFY